MSVSGFYLYEEYSGPAAWIHPPCTHSHAKDAKPQQRFYGGTRKALFAVAPVSVGGFQPAQQGKSGSECKE